MCELLAMSCRHPAVVTLSLDEFARHGGESAHHVDGWGIAFFDASATDVIVLREPVQASTSALLRWIKEHQFESSLVVSHIRLATRGEVGLRNTQPFQRELGGRRHVFAHNGDLPGVDRLAPTGAYQPVGNTDSEIAFCQLLTRASALWRSQGTPSLAARIALVAEFAAELRPLGPANFIYSDGDALFAHGHKRTDASGTIRPPGLFWLQRTCCEEPGPGGTVIHSRQPQSVILVASVPLTDEAWVPCGDGELIVARSGAVSHAISASDELQMIVS